MKTIWIILITLMISGCPGTMVVTEPPHISWPVKPVFAVTTKVERACLDPDVERRLILRDNQKTGYYKELEAALGVK